MTQNSVLYNIYNSLFSAKFYSDSQAIDISKNMFSSFYLE